MIFLEIGRIIIYMRIFILLTLSALLLSACAAAPPIVSISGGGVDVDGGQLVTLTVKLSPPARAEDFTYSWSVGGETVAGTNGAVFSWSTPLVSSEKTVLIAVSASAEGRQPVSAVSTILIRPSSIINLNQSGDFTYSPDLGSSARDVFFIFSNAGSSEIPRPSVRYISDSRSASLISSSTAGGTLLPAADDDLYLAVRGRDDAAAFGLDPIEFLPSGPSSRSPEPESFIPPGSTAHADSLGSSAVLNDRGTSINATCRKIVTADGRVLNIWVQDSFWNGTAIPFPGKINQNMVDALADLFLKAGAQNDIYDWATGIFGPEWGSHIYSNLITANNEISIVLYDIGGDGLPGTGEGRIAGLFDPKNNYKPSYVPESNGRLMFFLDAPLFANDGDGNGWSISDDYWPAQIVSTLVHEFQHMIHFYQKTIRNGLNRGSDQWLNEMCSMVAEDLLSAKIKTNGPRGVSWDDYTAGLADNTSGRLARYNFYNDVSLTYWPGSSASSSEKLNHYSISYSFGAYLIRNYGGAALIREIVRNEHVDERAVVAALAASGHDLSFDELLRRWGIAVLLSDRQNSPGGYEYNRGRAFAAAVDGLAYDLGSISLYNYYFNQSGEQQRGPKIYSGSTAGQNRLPASSKTIYRAGSSLSGVQSWEVSLPDGIRMSVLFR